MISERRRAANRANARKSTGPRTAAGKARASRNATGHGLASAIADPAVLAAIAELAAALAGEGACADRLQHARAMAEADFDLRRARAVLADRRTVLTTALEELARTPAIQPDEAFAVLKQRCGFDLERGLALSQRCETSAHHERSVAGLRRAALALAELPRQTLLQKVRELRRDLARLERYVARAQSRRRTALRRLDKSPPVPAPAPAA